MREAQPNGINSAYAEIVRVETLLDRNRAVKWPGGFAFVMSSARKGKTEQKQPFHIKRRGISTTAERPGFQTAGYR
jgi:hypothetical protein